MKAVIIYGGVNKKENILNLVIKVVSDTLKELNVEVEEIILDHYNIDYYNKGNKKDIKQITQKIKEADAVIFATKVILMAPTGIIKVFLDNLVNPNYKESLKNKQGFAIAISDSIGEREAAEYILRAWEMLGGVEGGRIPLYIKDSKEIEDIKETIEKRIEDFYRISRQQRLRLPSSDNNRSYIESINKKGISESNESKITPWAPPIVVKTDNPEEKVEIKSVNFEQFTEEQAKDIEELADFFKEQLGGNNKDINSYGIYQKPSTKAVVENKKTCKQMTKNLCHYFQPHLAAEFKGVFQFNIKGAEGFESYIRIENGECTYFEGVNENADIVMIMNEDIWIDILKGKLSAQKGFMTGQLKVRGNFMLLNKLDQLFKKM